MLGSKTPGEPSERHFLDHLAPHFSLFPLPMVARMFAIAYTHDKEAKRSWPHHTGIPFPVLLLVLYKTPILFTLKKPNKTHSSEA